MEDPGIWDQIGTLFAAIVALCTTLLTALGVWIKWQLGRIDHSVNHKHKHGRDETLYDLQHMQTEFLEVIADDLRVLKEWRESYNGGPLDDGTKVIEFVELVMEDMKKNKTEHSEIMEILNRISAHIEGQRE